LLLKGYFAKKYNFERIVLLNLINFAIVCLVGGDLITPSVPPIHSCSNTTVRSLQSVWLSTRN